MISLGRFILIISLFLGLQPTTIFAQDDDDSEPSDLHVFRGGYMDFNFAMNLNMVGSSIGSGGMGGLITSRVDNGALSVNLNPAHLVSLKKGYSN